MARPSFYGWVAFHCGEGSGTPLQCSLLENPTVEGAWWAVVRGVAKSRTRLSNFPFTFHVHALEKEMATHSSALAWRIPGTGEPGGLPSVGSCRVGDDWSDLAAAAAASHCVCIPHLLYSFIINGHLGFVFVFSRIFVIVNNAVVNTQVYISFWNMVLERIMLSEISQMKKDKHCTISLICGI